MAAQNNKNINGLEIKLNEVFVAKRRLRYIYLCHPNVVSTVWDEGCECMPLFLGSDVLGECNISQGNLPRLHASHATRGLATKVNFPPRTKVLGIHGTGRGVWFYSVQGLFKIAFEYYSRIEQDGCLRELETVWRSCLLDPLLKTEEDVVVGRQLEVPCEQSGLQTMLLASTLSPDCQEKSLGMRLEPASATTCQDKTDVVKQICQHIDQLMLETDNETTELQLLNTYLSFINQDDKDCFLSGVANMFRNCLALLPVNSESCDFLHREVILTEIAHWLGKEFSNYYDYVSERVTLFKQKHIRSIENLPCAETLVNEVFPKSMQVLLYCWLNPSGGSENKHSDVTLFPVIQIILELANRNLLSGVAHVLYSRLILSESV